MQITITKQFNVEKGCMKNSSKVEARLPDGQVQSSKLFQ